MNFLTPKNFEYPITKFNTCSAMRLAESYNFLGGQMVGFLFGLLITIIVLMFHSTELKAASVIEQDAPEVADIGPVPWYLLNEFEHFQSIEDQMPEDDFVAGIDI